MDVFVLPTSVEPFAPSSVNDSVLKPRGRVHASPVSWRDQVLYFLLPDRFSDGGEGSRPLFDRNSPVAFLASNKGGWMEAGKAFQGGTIKGISSKLSYLKKLGVTALWIGPLWKQRFDLETYHGYGIQNFLDVDPRFGTRQDLRDLVDSAHRRGMYVILDIIYNHSGNNWFYRSDEGECNEVLPYKFSPAHQFGGWRSKSGKCVDHTVDVEDGVMPKEFRNPDWYTRAGHIGRWDPEPWEDPMHDNNEFRRGDFFDLKDLRHDRDDVLSSLIRAYQYWIALSDCDGFRIDTVKHTSFEASRNFCGAIREYAESIGKENFLLLGEITGGSEMVRDYLELFGRNIDAALDIGEPADRLADMVKGFRSPSDFFGQFGGQDAFGSHRVIGRYHVSILDDHDMVGRRNGKRRFLANNDAECKFEQVAHAVGVQLLTLGIPCIYYGTEQAFDGGVDRHHSEVEPLANNEVPFGDRYIRESMFGGSFGAFQTEKCHFFDPNHPTYLRIGTINKIRRRKDMVGLALRRGRQYLRKISNGDFSDFRFPSEGELVAWSRICYSQDVIVVLNTSGEAEKSAFISVDSKFHPEGSTMKFMYKGDWSDENLKNPGSAPAETVLVKSAGGTFSFSISLPPAGMAILA